MPTGNCVALLSGGLDSQLAARLILNQGIKVTGINFAGAYCPRPAEGKSSAERAAEQLGIELVILPIDSGFIDLVKAPKYGRGGHMNPCIDCHILMIQRAWEWGKEHGADFVVTGEVLGQRPMSQNKQALGIVARRSQTDGRLLRPMSAQMLEPTEPEKQGLVDRAKLLDIQGRGRKRQIALAAQLGIKDYPTPAGGCLLTDAGYSNRLKEAFEHREDSVASIELLHIGRHFRLSSGAKVIVGRDEAENKELLRRTPATSVVIDGTALPGPIALLLKSDSSDPSDKSDRLLTARLCARYSDRRDAPEVTVLIDGEPLAAKPATDAESASLVVG